MLGRKIGCKTNIVHFVIAYLILLVLAILLKILTCLLPAELVQTNIRNSVALLKEEGVTYRSDMGILYDNATDAQVLSICYSSVGGENAFYNAFADVQYSWDDSNDSIEWLQRLVNYVEGGKKLYVNRHWCGVTVPLKILFSFMNYEQIRILEMILLFVVLFVFIAEIYCVDKILAVSFGISFISIDVISASLTVNSYTVCFLTVLSCYILLKNKKIMIDNCYLYLFVIGAITSFFDLMSSPIMTYLYVCYIILYFVEVSGIKDLLLFFLKTGVSWILGYVSFWTGKWLISSMILKKNMFLDVIAETSRMVDGKIVDWMPDNKADVIRDAIIKNGEEVFVFKMFKGMHPIIIATVCIVVVFLIAFFIFRNRHKTEFFWKCIGMIILAAIPLGWFVCACNQSYIYYNISYRILGVSVLTLTYLFVSAVGLLKENQRRRYTKFHWRNGEREDKK